MEEHGVLQTRIPGSGTLNYPEGEYNDGTVEGDTARNVSEMRTGDPKKRAVKKKLYEVYADRPPRRRRQLSVCHARPDQQAPAATGAHNVFSPHVLTFQLRLKRGSYQQLHLINTLAVTGRWREAILTYSNDFSEAVRRILSGHNADGGPADDPHLAFVPLASVGHEHVDGHLLGMGLALPAGLSRDERSDALRAAIAVRVLKLGPLGAWAAEPVTASQPPWNLRADAWTAYPKGATHWSTVTPVAFDRHPKTRSKAQYQQELTTMIAGACTRIGLPEPREVIVTQVSTHFGVPPSFSFPRLERKDGSRRQHSHAILVFGEPVCGPMLIGAGRYRGYGVCRPLDAVGAGGRRAG
jgi:CRISPR-associated protein Csb2